MLPATDRASNGLTHRLTIGLALAVSAADLGCSRLKSQRQAPVPAMLGVEQVGNDSYANARRPRTPEAQPRAEAVDPMLPERGEGRGSPASPPAPDEAGPAVALQPPVAPEPRDASRPPSAIAATVPNASRLIAASGRRGDPAPAWAEPRADAGQVVARARAALDAMATYQVVLHRQERVNGVLLPEEDLVLAIRRDPRAVRLTWPSGPHRGREVLYRADEPGGQMHVNMADSAIPVPRLTIAPDSPMVLRNSRHPVTEAGFDPLIASLEEAARRPDGGLVLVGLETPATFDRPLRRLDRVAPSGEHWRAWFDPKTSLPALVECSAGTGELLERYTFRDFQADPAELATAAAFDPNARWGPPRGLLGRLGRGAEPANPATLR